MIICLGDSHSSVFSLEERIISQWPKKEYKIFSNFKPIRIGPATAYNLAKKTTLLNKILNHSDVFVTATLSEGYANVINQAIASGCPVIVTENSGAKEYVEQNKCGLVVPIRNSQKIYEKLSLLLDDKNLLRHLSENSKNSAKDNTWNNYVDRLDTFINRNM